jgi:DNA-binding response OmpR family regulator
VVRTKKCCGWRIRRHCGALLGVGRHDGSAAMDLFLAHKGKIDAVLLDFTLPGKSSREVFEEIRCARPNVKIILTSAYSEETVAASGLRTTHFIRKPFKLAELAGVLRNVLSA